MKNAILNKPCLTEYLSHRNFYIRCCEGQGKFFCVKLAASLFLGVLGFFLITILVVACYMIW